MYGTAMESLPSTLYTGRPFKGPLKSGIGGRGGEENKIQTESNTSVEVFEGRADGKGLCLEERRSRYVPTPLGLQRPFIFRA